VAQALGAAEVRLRGRPLRNLPRRRYHELPPPTPSPLTVFDPLATWLGVGGGWWLQGNC
jgi:hypothetical protein